MTTSRRPAPPTLRDDGRHDALGRGEAEVRRNQQLFEGLDRVHVQRTAVTTWLIRAPDDLIEAGDDLLGGARKTITNPAEYSSSTESYHPVSASAR